MTTTERDVTGLGEARLRPEESEANPFNIFYKQLPDNIITDCEEILFPTFNSLDASSETITFQVPPFSKKFVKLDSTRLYGTARILEIGEDGALKAPADSVDISVVNNLPCSVFNRVALRLNDLELETGQSQSYAYKAFLETLFSFNQDYKESILQNSMWYQDPPAHAKVFKATEGSGFNTRKDLIKLGKPFHFESFIFSDIFWLAKYLLPNISMRLEFSKEDEKFFLLGDKAKYNGKYKLVFDRLQLSLKAVSVDKDFFERQLQALLRSNATYPMIQSFVTFNSIPANIRQHNITGIASGILPTLLFIGLLDNNAKTGSIELNPFCFEPHNVGSVQFIINGSLKPAKRYEPNWATEKNFTRCYRDFCDLIGLSSQSNTIKFTKEMFSTNLCFYGVDLTGCPSCNNSHIHQRSEKAGSVSVEIVFETPPTVPLQLLTFSTFRKKISIDALRNLTIDY